MKLLSQMIIVLLLIIPAQGFAATCEATNGFFVSISSLPIGKTRVPGNAIINVFDSSGQLLVGFSAYTDFMGLEPIPGEQYDYNIQYIFQDKIGLKKFTWSTHNGCPRCPPHMNHLPSQIKIVSNLGRFLLVCKQ